MRSYLRSLVASFTLLGFLLAPGLAAAKKAPASGKVLGMRVEGDNLSKKDKDDLFKVVQAKLRSYPKIELVKPPEGDITDEMIDLECIDVDADCLSKLGKKYKADTVFYAQVDKKGDAYSLLVRVIVVKSSSAVRENRSDVAALTDLSNALGGEVEVAFGAPPKPAVAEDGTLEVVASIAGAKIYINGDYVGTGSVRLKKSPGKYTVRVARDGYEEVVTELEVVGGQTVSREVDLKEASVVVTPPGNGDGNNGKNGGGANGGGENGKKPPVTKDDPFYEKAWFWGIIAGVVAAGATIAVVAAVSGDEETGSHGAVVFSVDPQNAWRDAAVVGGAP